MAMWSLHSTVSLSHPFLTLLSINYCFASDKGDSLPNDTHREERMNALDNNGGLGEKRKV